MGKIWGASLFLSIVLPILCGFQHYATVLNRIKKNLLKSHTCGCPAMPRKHIYSQYWRLWYSPLQWAAIPVNISQHSMANKHSYFPMLTARLLAHTQGVGPEPCEKTHSASWLCNMWPRQDFHPPFRPPLSLKLLLTILCLNFILRAKNSRTLLTWLNLHL